MDAQNSKPPANCTNSPKKRPRPPFMRWITPILIFAVIVSFIFGFLVCLLHPWNLFDSQVIGLVDYTPSAISTVETTSDSNDKTILTVSTVESIISNTSDLITTKYLYKDADTYENVRKWIAGWDMPLSKYELVFTYSGSIGLGIDMSKIICSVDNNKKEILITLPEIEIKSNEIDESSFEYPIEKKEIFSKNEIGDFVDLISALKKQHQESTLNDETIVNNAKANAKNVILSFLNASTSTTGYQVVFAD
jgi:hypothetical protein